MLPVPCSSLHRLSVAVSLVGGEERWAGLFKQLARDLSVLATVVWLSEEAGWGLTDELGGRLSCFNGAVRLYWPVLKGGAEPRVPRRVWTPDRRDSLNREGDWWAGCATNCG